MLHVCVMHNFGRLACMYLAWWVISNGNTGASDHPTWSGPMVACLLPTVCRTIYARPADTLCWGNIDSHTCLSADVSKAATGAIQR